MKIEVVLVMANITFFSDKGPPDLNYFKEYPFFVLKCYRLSKVQE